MAEHRADAVLVGLARGQMPLVVVGDAVARNFESSKCLGRARGDGRIHFGSRYTQADCAEIDVVELLREIDEGLIATIAHVGDDGADGHINIDGRFPLHGEQGLEVSRKIGVVV